MKLNENKTTKGKKFFKKVDPISFALVVLLGASASFAAFQLMTGTDAPVINLPGTNDDDTTIPVVSNVEWLDETVLSPLSLPEEDVAVVTTGFFNGEADSSADVVDSLFFFPLGTGFYSENSFGTSFSAPNGEEADVVAILSGVVTSVDVDEILRGTIVTIQHENGAESIYTGLYNSTVTVGEEVERGQVLGTTGPSLMEPEAGNVVHLEFLLDGDNVNPESVLNQRLGDL